MSAGPKVVAVTNSEIVSSRSSASAVESVHVAPAGTCASCASNSACALGKAGWLSVALPSGKRHQPGRLAAVIQLPPSGAWPARPPVTAGWLPSPAAMRSATPWSTRSSSEKALRLDCGAGCPSSVTVTVP